jgi:hypothetical protein
MLLDFHSCEPERAKFLHSSRNDQERETFPNVSAVGQRGGVPGGQRPPAYLMQNARQN